MSTDLSYRICFNYTGRDTMQNEFIAPVGPAVTFGPEGLHFIGEVELRLPYETAKLPVNKTVADLAVYWWNGENGSWDMLSSEPEAAITRLKAKTVHFSVYQVMARGILPLVADPAFSAGEAYVYPNPTHGNNPTFHFECGLADSARVTVFDISGHKMYDADMGAPQTIAGKYAYRNTWGAGNTASGVYIYILRAQKAGSGAIVKKGKVAVVR